MDIREVSDEEKRRYINRVTETFNDMRSMLSTVEVDMNSTDLMIQASAVWIGGNLCSWYSDFLTQIREIDQKQKSLREIQTEIEEVVEANGKEVSRH